MCKVGSDEKDFLARYSDINYPCSRCRYWFHIVAPPHVSGKSEAKKVRCVDLINKSRKYLNINQNVTSKKERNTELDEHILWLKMGNSFRIVICEKLIPECSCERKVCLPGNNWLLSPLKYNSCETMKLLRCRFYCWKNSWNIFWNNFSRVAESHGYQ